MVSQNDSVALKDASITYRACSIAYARSLGRLSPDEVIGRTDLDLLPEPIARQQMSLDTQILLSAKADIGTIRLGSSANQANTAAMIVRTPIVGDGNIVQGIDLRLIGGPAMGARQSAITIDYGLLVKEGLQGSLIINDHEVLFANDAAARTLGYASAEDLQNNALLYDLFTREQLVHLKRAAVTEANDPARTMRASVTARRLDGTGVRLITRNALVNWGASHATLLSFIDLGDGQANTIPTRSVESDKAVEGEASLMRRQLDALERDVAISTASSFVSSPAAVESVSHPTSTNTQSTAAVANVTSQQPTIATKTASAKLAEVAQRFHDFVRATADCYWELDERLVFRMVSKQTQTVLGVGDDVLVGRTIQQWLEMPANVNGSAHWEEHLRRLNDRQPFRDTEFRWLVDGETRVFRYSGMPVFGSGNTFKGYRCTVCDVTTSVRKTEAITYHANHDALTGLVNRRSFEADVEEALEDSRQTRTGHAMCFMDLDGFKAVNDTSGHEAGDELLRQLGQLFDQLVRKSDVLARLGGDEFGVFLYNCKVAEAIKLANQIRHEVENFEFPWGEHTFSVGVSIGLVVVDDRWENIESVFRAADAACYIAKDEGRNRVVVYRDGAGYNSNRKVATQWVEEINSALEQERFRLAAQKIMPLVDQPDGVRFEMLSRLELPNGSIVNPSSFYPAAERYGLSSALDRRIIELTIKWVSQNEELRRDLRHVSLNLSSGSFTDPEFTAWLIEQVHQSVLRPEQFCFELGETATIANLAAVSKFMGELTGIGCRFSIDHFGSALSSFGYLRKLPIDFLKIDGLLVRDILDDPTDLTMVKAICDITRSMGKRTVAEHIESPRLMNAARDVGADFVQGNHIGEPELVTID